MRDHPTSKGVSTDIAGGEAIAGQGSTAKARDCTAIPIAVLAPCNGVMTERRLQSRDETYKFILEQIDSVPHLEALMLLWNSHPATWRISELAARLYLPPDKVSALLADLIRLELIAESGDTEGRFGYFSQSAEQDEMMHQVDETYRQDLVRISTMIHSKASSAVREFARAFRWKKEQDG